MELAFDSRELRELCEQQELAIARLGEASALDVSKCLADLRASSTIRDLPTVVKYQGERREVCIIVDAEANYRMEFVPNHPNVPRDEDDGVDWSKVSRIRITKLGNHTE